MSSGKSLITFIRKALKVKGKSEHTGRGSVWMTSHEPLTFDEVLSKVKSLLPLWKNDGLILDVKEDEDGISVLFTGEVFDPYYRTLHFNKQMTGSYIKWMKSYMICVILFGFPKDTVFKD